MTPRWSFVKVSESTVCASWPCDIFSFEEVFQEVDCDLRKSVAVHDHNLADSAAVTGVQ